MRFAVIHCRTCLRHVWVPEDKLGLPGHCPDCGAQVQAPTDWPEAQLVEGPHVVHDFEAGERELVGGRR